MNPCVSAAVRGHRAGLEEPERPPGIPLRAMNEDFLKPSATASAGVKKVAQLASLLTAESCLASEPSAQESLRPKRHVA